MDTPAAAPAAPAATAATTPASGAAPATTEQFFEVKVDGAMKKYTRAEAERMLSKAGFADKTVSQAKEALKQLAAERERIKAQDALWDDDEKLEAELEKRGKLDKLARKRLQAKVAEQEMTPEQREAATAKAERDALKKQLEERDSEAKKAKQAEGQKVLQRQLEDHLAGAAERAGMSRDADSFFAIYEALAEWHRLGLPFDADRIVETAKENIDSGFKRLEQSVLKGLKGKALVERLGGDVVKEILRFKAKEFRDGGARPNPAAPALAKKTEPATYISPTDLQAKYRGAK